MAENLSYNPYIDMHNDVQLSAMFFGKNFQNIPIFNPTQTIEVKRLCYSLERFTFTGKERDSETGFSYFGAGKISQNILLIALLCIGLNANAKIDMNNKIVLCNASNVVLCNEVCEKDSVSSFFNRFCADSNFQYSRTIFPVKCTVKMDAYDEPDIEEIIEKKNWKYSNFLNLPTNYLIEIERVNETTFKLNLQIEDTGVYVDYLFELIDCNWYLIRIISSTT